MILSSREQEAKCESQLWKILVAHGGSRAPNGYEDKMLLFKYFEHYSICIHLEQFSRVTCIGRSILLFMTVWSKLF